MIVSAESEFEVFKKEVWLGTKATLALLRNMYFRLLQAVSLQQLMNNKEDVMKASKRFDRMANRVR